MRLKLKHDNDGGDEDDGSDSNDDEKLHLCCTGTRSSLIDFQYQRMMVQVLKRPIYNDGETLINGFFKLKKSICNSQRKDKLCTWCSNDDGSLLTSTVSTPSGLVETEKGKSERENSTNVETISSPPLVTPLVSPSNCSDKVEELTY